MKFLVQITFDFYRWRFIKTSLRYVTKLRSKKCHFILNVLKLWFWSTDFTIHVFSSLSIKALFFYRNNFTFISKLRFWAVNGKCCCNLCCFVLKHSEVVICDTSYCSELFRKGVLRWFSWNDLGNFPKLVSIVKTIILLRKEINYLVVNF